MFKKVKKFELRGRIYVVVATERFERMDILSGQNTESVDLGLTHLGLEASISIVTSGL